MIAPACGKLELSIMIGLKISTEKGKLSFYEESIYLFLSFDHVSGKLKARFF